MTSWKIDLTCLPSKSLFLSRVIKLSLHESTCYTDLSKLPWNGFQQHKSLSSCTYSTKLTCILLLERQSERGWARRALMKRAIVIQDAMESPAFPDKIKINLMHIRNLSWFYRTSMRNQLPGLTKRKSSCLTMVSSGVKIPWFGAHRNICRRP